MRVDCDAIDDFIENLKSGSLPMGVVFLSVTRRKAERDSVREEIAIHASAVVRTIEGIEYLLQAGEGCGVDYCDATREKKGSERANGLRKQVNDFCTRRGWEVRPGVVGE